MGLSFALSFGLEGLFLKDLGLDLEGLEFRPLGLWLGAYDLAAESGHVVWSCRTA